MDFHVAVHESEGEIPVAFKCLEVKRVETLPWVKQEMTVKNFVKMSEEFRLEWKKEHCAMGQEQTVLFGYTVATS